jgi:RES domain-containing protein
MIEYLAHVDPDVSPDDLVLATAEVPDSINRERISINRLPKEWRQSPPPPALAEIGDAFIRERRTAILLVPSVLAPKEFNWLLNPVHRNFRRIRITATELFSYDPRLLR